MQIPISIESRESTPEVVSVETDAVSFDEPFFVDTLRAQFGIHVNEADQTSLVRPLLYDKAIVRTRRTPLDEWMAEHRRTRARPRGCIFHVSRCGSTLVTQMLVASKRFHVLSEPQIVSEILDPRQVARLPFSQHALLETALAALSAAAPAGLPTVVKFRSWSTLYADRIIAAAPDARWLFVHRHTLEVLASVLKDPPGWLRGRRSYAGEFAGFMGLSQDETDVMTDEEYAVRMLGAICRSPHRLPAPSGLCLDYEGIGDWPSLLASHFGLPLAAADVERMTKSAHFYSKDPQRKRWFEPDSAAKRAGASVTAVKLTSTLAEPHRKNLPQIGDEL